MFTKFKYEPVPLRDISLDYKNPRIVTQTPLSTQKEILAYLFEQDDLEDFIKKIAIEGKNIGAERPYIVKSKGGYTVIEGNTRIAAYKVLTGLLTAPSGYSVPHITQQAKAALLTVDCTIAPNRDALLPIMASAHFGLGDKSKWGYLGSRKALYDEWKAGWSIPRLAKAFNRPQSEIKELILEYMLYLQALSFTWSKHEEDVLLDPSVQFNPPVRFLQTSGHKEKVGISYDTTNLKVVFADSEAKRKFHHLLQKLVISPQKGLGATASYNDVFVDYTGNAAKKSTAASTKKGAGKSKAGGQSQTSATGAQSSALKPNTLFPYTVTVTNALLTQLLSEARDLNCKKFPAAGTFLLRNVVEAILRHIIDQQKANTAHKMLDLEGSIGLCLSKNVSLPITDKKILKEFLKSYVLYLNLGAHGNVIPNYDMVCAARDCIDQFVKKYV